MQNIDGYNYSLWHKVFLYKMTLLFLTISFKFGCNTVIKVIQWRLITPYPLSVQKWVRFRIGSLKHSLSMGTSNVLAVSDERIFWMGTGIVFAFFFTEITYLMKNIEKAQARCFLDFNPCLWSVIQNYDCILPSSWKKGTCIHICMILINVLILSTMMLIESFCLQPLDVSCILYLIRFWKFDFFDLYKFTLRLASNYEKKNIYMSVPRSSNNLSVFLSFQLIFIITSMEVSYLGVFSESIWSSYRSVKY